ncbi:hypothetical protein, partial [Burkholderia gladioli]
MKIVTSRDAAGGVIDNQPEQLCTQLELHLNGWCRFMVALEPVTPVVPPFLTAVRSRGYGAISNFCFGGTPPM